MKKLVLMISAMLMQMGIAMADGRIFAEEVTIEPGGKATLDIQLTTAEKEFCNFQFDIVLAEGLSLEEDEEGYVVVDEGDRFPKRNSNLDIQRQADGKTYRVLFTNSKLTPLNGTEGTLFKVTLQAAATMSEGTAACSISGIVLSRPEGTKATPADEPFNVAVSNTTAIRTVGTTSAPRSVYDIKGRKMATAKALRKGLYIMDGKKVRVK